MLKLLAVFVCGGVALLLLLLMHHTTPEALPRGGAAQVAGDERSAQSDPTTNDLDKPTHATGEAPRIDEALSDYFVLRGNVVDHDTEQPIHEAAVAIAVRDGATGLLTRKSAASTDGSGEFAIPECPNKVTFLIVTCSGYADVTQVTPLPSDNTTVGVPLGTVVSAGIIRLHRGCTIKGRVTDSTGAPLGEGAQLYVFEGGESGLSAPAEYVGATGEDGTFALPKPTCIATDNTHLLAVTRDAIGYVRLAGCCLEAGQEVECNITMQPSCRIAIKAVDSRQLPIEDAHVACSSQSYPLAAFSGFSWSLIGIAPAESLLSQVLRGRTGRDGTFVSNSLPQCAAPDGHGYQLTIWKSGCGKVTVTAPTTRQGEQSEPLTVTLPDETARLHLAGHVVDTSGAPISGAVVIAPNDQRVYTLPSGQFVFDCRSPNLESFILSARAEGYSPGGVRVTLLDKSSNASLVDHLITLSKPSTIRGRVVDSNGRPVAGASVSAFGRDRLHPLHLRAAPSITSGNGVFSIYDVPQNELVDLRCEDMTGVGQEVRAPIIREARGGEDGIVLVSSAIQLETGSVSARLVGAPGRGALFPVATCIISGLDRAAAGTAIVPSRVVRRADGVSISGVPIGEWQLWACANDGSLGMVTFVLRDPNQTVHTELQMSQPIDVSGRLVFKDGLTHGTEDFTIDIGLHNDCKVPTHEAWATIPCRTHGRTHADEQGMFKFVGLVPGEYDILVIGQLWRGLGTAKPEAGVDPFTEILMSKGAYLTVRGPKIVPGRKYILEIVEGRNEPRVLHRTGDGQSTLLTEEDIVPGVVGLRVAEDRNDSSTPTAIIYDKHITVQPGASATVLVDKD